MTAKLSFYIPVIFSLCFAAALFGQIDSYQLRAKYGAPLDRETFTISPDFQTIVDYGPDQQVRRLELPTNTPSSTQQQVDDLLLQLVPTSMRGNELGSGLTYMGRASIRTTEYEHVIVSEPQDPDLPGVRTSVTVVFKSSATSLFDQIDSYHLRAKWGPPIARETFTIAASFQMTVDYGPDQQACRLELPANRPGASSPKQADDVLLELVPMSMRGKQLNSFIVGGLNSIKSTVYEHVVISDSGSRVSVSFNREVCRNP